MYSCVVTPWSPRLSEPTLTACPHSLDTTLPPPCIGPSRASSNVRSPRCKSLNSSSVVVSSGPRPVVIPKCPVRGLDAHVAPFPFFFVPQALPSVTCSFVCPPCHLDKAVAACMYSNGHVGNPLTTYSLCLGFIRPSEGARFAIVTNVLYLTPLSTPLLPHPIYFSE